MSDENKSQSLELLDLVSDGKKIHNFVTNTLKGYVTNRHRLHVAACAVVYHAMEHGDIRLMNTFFTGLLGKDRDAFRIWAGYVTTIILRNEEDGKETKTPTISFSKDNGFSVRKGTENYRKGAFDIRELVNGEPFFIFAKPKPEKDDEALLFLDWLKGLKSSISKQMKKAEGADFNVPVDLKKELEILELKAKAFLEAASNQAANVS